MVSVLFCHYMTCNFKLNQKGFHALVLVLGLAIITVLTITGYTVYKKSESKQKSTESFSSAPAPNDPNAPPLKLKSIGINIDDYDPATNRAGDIVFTDQKIQGYNTIFFDYGAVAEASSAGARRLNPQPTIILPLGTKVRSLVDGVVVNVPQLYSNDYSIQVGENKDSQWLYETEHVINPLVKVGDAVKAGQVIAEVSTHDSQYHPGFGLYEIGILHAGNPPQHVCPFNYLDDSIKQDVHNKLTSFYKAWENYKADESIYDESKHATPGCYTLDPIDG